jgi:hypothetical protein
MGEIQDAICKALAEESPMTVRQVFYALVSSGMIEKTELQYRAVVSVLGQMRREGQIKFEMIADNTREPMVGLFFADLPDGLTFLRREYRRNRWDNQREYVEIWLEKDALSGVIYPITSKLNVPLMVTRGYPSLSFLHNAAKTIAEKKRRCYLYYFGDHDPSGVDITRSVDDGIREFAPDADVIVKRIAVTEEQIKSLKLPTRPTKTTDARARGWEGGSVELDAIPANTLREMVSSCIVQHIDARALAKMERAERADRKQLIKLIG